MAARIFPLNWQFRQAVAISLASIAMQNANEPLWKQAALPELEDALRVDPTSAVLLAPAITFELDMHQDALAKRHYKMFKMVAKDSPLNGLVNAPHP